MFAWLIYLQREEPPSQIKTKRNLRKTLAATILLNNKNEEKQYRKAL